MKNIPILAAIIWMAFPATSHAEHLIPEDSKQPWDFRGKPRTLTHPAYEKLFSCRTYEELRDALIVAIESLEQSIDCAAPSYAASSCRLALIRTYYLLGDVGNADRLLERYAAVHRKEDGSPDFGDKPLRPQLDPEQD